MMSRNVSIVLAFFLSLLVLRGYTKNFDLSSFVVDFPTSRDPYQQPFASWSIWNLPIGKSANYVYAGIQRATERSMTADPDIIILKPESPSVEVWHNSDGWSGRSRCEPEVRVLYTCPIPYDFIVPGATPHSTPNYAGACLLKDNVTIAQGNPFTRCTAGGPATVLAHYPSVDIRTDGIVGAHGGSALSSIGGTIRLGELVPSAPLIRHALKINLDASNLYPGGDPIAYRWPASKADSCAPGCYTGTNPALKMGSFLALNSSFDIDKMAFETEPGKRLAWTFQNYGAYIVSVTGWSVYAIETEMSPDGVVTQEFEKAWGFAFESNNDTPWARDMVKIFLSLSVVDSWNDSIWKEVVNSNGALGSGGGAPLQPWAPPLM